MHLRLHNSKNHLQCLKRNKNVNSYHKVISEANVHVREHRYLQVQYQTPLIEKHRLSSNASQTMLIAILNNY